MEKIKLNETPVRTSRNFRINNIKLENIWIPEEIKEFKNIKILNENSKLEIIDKTSDINLTYGLNEIFTKQVENSANNNTQLIVNSKTNKETQIEFNFDELSDVLVEDIEIVANEDTKATIIIKYNSSNNIKAFHNGIIRTKAKPGSNINIIIVNLLNNNSDNFIAIQNVLEENAKVNYSIIDFGGKHSITNYYSNLIGEKSENNLNSIYLGSEEQIFDLNYIGELRGVQSNIKIEVQGALKDYAKKHFKGTIDFKKGCKKAKGYENEACMLLSDTAKSLALPMLLCSEEDVEGNHSSSAGKIGAKELFYIMSRGFKFKEAMKLLVRAKFNKILKNIQNEELRQTILKEIDKKI
ncbi:MAG: SufD family Fe-S cluster assembly protein [Clostridia bacterium]|nr:SufD family Fe-S cluster assembly protein [Clostridia bacterium]